MAEGIIFKGVEVSPGDIVEVAVVDGYVYRGSVASANEEGGHKNIELDSGRIIPETVADEVKSLLRNDTKA